MLMQAVVHMEALAGPSSSSTDKVRHDGWIDGWSVDSLSISLSRLASYGMVSGGCGSGSICSGRTKHQAPSTKNQAPDSWSGLELGRCRFQIPNKDGIKIQTKSNRGLTNR